MLQKQVCKRYKNLYEEEKEKKYKYRRNRYKNMSKKDKQNVTELIFIVFCIKSKSRNFKTWWH